MAAFYFFNAWDWHKAEAESQRAIELNPNNAEARHILSHILSVMNRDDEAVQEAKQSDEIDPSGRPTLLGLALLQARQYDAAIGEFERARRNPAAEPLY
jgi:tetratricopeptide (TPR) repeat protein